MTEGESYSDLGGQLPDESQRELGLRRVEEMRRKLAAAKAEQERIEALENEENVDG